jgi:Flp pilus assembly protein TadD
MLQQMLGLGDEDVLLIQQEVEAQFVYQSAVYQQNLAQYELALTEAIEREFPFSQQDLQGLESLRQSLGLRNEDVTIIKQPLIQQAESRYQEKLRQQSELRRQEQEKVEYASKLQRYEQEFIKAIQAEYPLNQFAIDELKAFQDQFRLRYEDINQIEQKIREPLERKYQEKLKQQELEKQEAAYTLNLQRYEREFNQAVQSSNPLSSEALNYWKNFQQSLNLKDEDVEKITKPILDQADVKYQDLLRKQAEERLKKQEEKHKVEYASKLQRYEQEFIKAIQAEYPLSQFVIDALSNLQMQLGLKYEDVTRVEKPFRETAEVKHQENLSQKKENDQVLERLKEIEEELLKVKKLKQEVDLRQQKQARQDADTQNNLGLTLLNQGKIGEAIAAFRKAIQLDPNDSIYHNNLGLALKNQGKIEEAIAAYRKAIQIDPNSANTHHNLGVALKKQGKIEEAIAAYRKAIQLDPNDSMYHNNLGLAFDEQWKKDEAISSIQKAIQLDPNNQTYKDNLKEVRKNILFRLF